MEVNGCQQLFDKNILQNIFFCVQQKKINLIKMFGSTIPLGNIFAYD